MSSSRSPLAEKDGETSEKVGDDVVLPIGQQEEPLAQNLAEENASENEAASGAVNPVVSDAAQMLTVLQNLLINNDIQRERLVRLIQLYDSAAQDINAREEELTTQVHFLEHSVQRIEEELENQKKANAELEEQIRRLTESSDP